MSNSIVSRMFTNTQAFKHAIKHTDTTLIGSVAPLIEYARPKEYNLKEFCLKKSHQHDCKCPSGPSGGEYFVLNFAIPTVESEIVR